MPPDPEISGNSYLLLRKQGAPSHSSENPLFFRCVLNLHSEAKKTKEAYIHTLYWKSGILITLDWIFLNPERVFLNLYFFGEWSLFLRSQFTFQFHVEVLRWYQNILLQVLGSLLPCYEDEYVMEKNIWSYVSFELTFFIFFYRVLLFICSFQTFTKMKARKGNYPLHTTDLWPFPSYL